MKKFLVVGAGFSGATIARELADSGHQVDVIDKRYHVGGNAFDYTDSYGIRVHMYGPHLFHTKNKTVFEYLSRFTEWLQYEHRVLAMLSDNSLVPFPPNRVTRERVSEEDIIDTFYRPYTRKMWGKPLEEVAPSIINRVPGRTDDEDRYFPTDTYQFMPKDGYKKLFDNMLNHDNINVRLLTRFDKSSEKSYDHVFNSMSIDEYYDYVHGTLDYRSIIFETMNISVPRVYPVTTVNFTHDGDATRVTEWKNIPGHGSNPYNTTITVEFPCNFTENSFERYYPMSDEINKERYKKYASIKNDRVTFIGRCGKYVYIDMDQAVNSALRIAMDFK